MLGDDVQNPYEFIGFGDIQHPCEFIGFSAKVVPKLIFRDTLHSGDIGDTALSGDIGDTDMEHIEISISDIPDISCIQRVVRACAVSSLTSEPHTYLCWLKNDSTMRWPCAGWYC